MGIFPVCVCICVCVCVCVCVLFVYRSLPRSHFRLHTLSILTLPDTTAVLRPQTSGETDSTRQLHIGVTRFLLMNHWLKNTMSESSLVSYYSRAPQARFFGNLVRENPFLIDHLLTISPEKLEATKVRPGPRIGLWWRAGD